ncbi:putative alcohol dehydrogenase [Whalleya microplaca]|nr:putative alcohol dehydrogenase [Whalleya microplaca]
MADSKNGPLANSRWILSSQNGLDSLQYQQVTPVRPDIGPEDVLVEIHAASLNYRDLVIAKANSDRLDSPAPMEIAPSVIPGSDGAGKVVAVGSSVLALRPDLKLGADVVMYMIPHIADDELPDFTDVGSGLGQRTNGTLCRRGIFHHSTLVRMPSNLTYEQAATLGCSGLTAWNALMGLEGHRVKEGDWVLVQGTGGVSLAALQIAVAAGARVIATTSSDAKAERLRALGAVHVLNYRSTPDWGIRAKKLTPENRGVDHVVDVGGQNTLSESLNAVRRNGLITVTGMIAGMALGFEKQPADLMSILWITCTARGVILGTRNMLREMVQFLEERRVQIAVDDVVFELENVKMAYERMEKQQHFGKIIIRMQ